MFFENQNMKINILLIFLLLSKIEFSFMNQQILKVDFDIIFLFLRAVLKSS